jgi:hypothetical protein
MISNERTWPSRQKVYSPQPYYERAARPQPRPFVQDVTLKSAELQIERKQFFLTLKENPRGRFLRISEEAGGRRNSIIIPATGLGEFQKLLEEVTNAAAEIPPQPASSVSI